MKQILISARSVWLAGLTLVGCTKPHAGHPPPEGPLPRPHAQSSLSLVERQWLKALPSSAPLRLLAVDATGRLTKHDTTAGTFEVLEKRIALQSPGAVIVPDLDVSLRHADAPGSLQVDKQLLLSGKEEFGLAAWSRAYPQADGRGVSIAVVDDGIALGRPGLVSTSTGSPKITRSINTSPVWQVPLRTERPACAQGVNTASAAKNSWKFVSAGDQRTYAEAILRVPFDVTPCGINPELPRNAEACSAFGKNIPNAEARTIEGIVRVPAVYVEAIDAESGKTTTRIFIDFDGDKRISRAEALKPLSQRGATSFALADGTAFGFDVHDTAKLFPPKAALDHPTTCPDLPAPAKTLTFIAPHAGEDFGSHGEGVASIAAGKDIAGQGFDGVAPGAQVVDVHFGDFVGGRRYNIGEIGRALKIAGMHSDLVNLSYSLFFDSHASQAAMGRLLEALLKDTRALYFFSAGNNGPGRGSMNRSLLYPGFGIAVGAYLNPAMAQTTFGSSEPFGGVVSYSSRGPGASGGPGALVISPLAGIVANTADEGFGPFSGTSSATPALAGFAARVVSQIKAEGLGFDRDLLKRGLVASARPLPDTAFVDQGHGLPELTRTMEIYRSLIAAPRRLPTLAVNGGVNPQGVPREGVFLRGQADRADAYTFELAPTFDDKWNENDVANYAETLKVTASAPWIRVPPVLFTSRSAAFMDLALDWGMLSGLGAGEHLATVRIANADTGETRAVVPVTVLAPVRTASAQVPERLEFPALDVNKGGLSRLFIDKPAWATHAIVTRESTTPDRPLCGRAALYSPSAVRLPALEKGSFGSGASMRTETLLHTPEAGVHELAIEGRNSHTVCPAAQTQRVLVQWVNVKISPIGVRVGEVSPDTGLADFVVGVQVSSDVSPGLGGTLVLDRLGLTRAVTLRTSRNIPWQWESETLDLSQFASVAFATDPAWALGRARLQGFRRIDLLVKSETGGAWPRFASLNQNAQFSQALPLAPEDARSVTLFASAFEFGLDSHLQNEGQLPLNLYGELPLLASVKAQSPVTNLRAGTPVALELAFTAHFEDVRGTSFLCGFRPSGSDVIIPCGVIALP